LFAGRIASSALLPSQEACQRVPGPEIKGCGKTRCTGKCRFSTSHADSAFLPQSHDMPTMENE
jgi:hypothetical protein